MIYEFEKQSRELHTHSTLKDCLLKAVKLTENADPDKYSYFGKDSGFGSRSLFLFQILVLKTFFHFSCRQYFINKC